MTNSASRLGFLADVGMSAARRRSCSLGLGGTMPPATAAPLPARGRGRGLRAPQPPSPRGDGTRLRIPGRRRMSASGHCSTPPRAGTGTRPPGNAASLPARGRGAPFSARGKGPRARARRWKDTRASPDFSLPGAMGVFQHPARPAEALDPWLESAGIPARAALRALLTPSDGACVGITEEALDPSSGLASLPGRCLSSKSDQWVNGTRFNPLPVRGRVWTHFPAGGNRPRRKRAARARAHTMTKIRREGGRPPSGLRRQVRRSFAPGDVPSGVWFVLWDCWLAAKRGGGLVVFG